MITKEQWKVIEAALTAPYRIMKFRCDGYQIAAQVLALKSMKLVIAVFVNGDIDGSWPDSEDERCTKFWQKKSKYMLSAVQRKKALLASKDKRLSKENRNFFRENAEKKFEYWQPYFETPGAFCRNIRKTCKEIELIKEK